MWMTAAFGAEGLDLAGHPVIEPGAYGDEEVALRHRVVRRLGAVHPEHPEAERVVAGNGSEPHQGRRHRDGGCLGKPQEFGRCPRVDHSPTGIDQGTLGLDDQVERSIDLADVPLVGGLVAPEGDLLRDGSPSLQARGDVFWEVDQHRAGAAGPRDVERLLDHAVGRSSRGSYVCDRHRDTGDVRFLERVVPEHAGRYLAGERNDRYRVHVCRRDPGHQVTRTGT